MPASGIAGVRKLFALLQQTRDPLFVLDHRRRLFFVNRAWEELTGLAAAGVLGLECRPPGTNEGDELAELVTCFYPPLEAQSGQAIGGPAQILRLGGERLWRRLEFWPLCDEQDRVHGLVGLVKVLNAVPTVPESPDQRLRAELAVLRDRLAHRYGFDSIIGSGPAHRRLLDQIKTAAATRVPILITGESGTGRRQAARVIHQRGLFPNAPFLAFDCSTLPAEVLESELCGPPPRDGEGSAGPGGLALPEGATLLLNEIYALPRDLQVRLVRALDGSVRLIAVATTNPEEARTRGQLRPELYFALTTLEIPIPPLRHRLTDLPILAQHFLARINDHSTRRLAGFDPETLRILALYDWPGNIRELARVIESAHASAAEDLVRPHDLPASIRGHLAGSYVPPPPPPKNAPLEEILTQVEQRLIEQALHSARNNKSRAAELLEISRPRLYRRIRELGIPDEPDPTEPNDETL